MSEGSGRPLLVLGTRTLAVEIADLACTVAGMHVEGFVENRDRKRAGTLLEGLPVFWVEELAHLAATHRAVCGLATTHRIRFVEQAAAFGVPFATIVHPSATMSTKSSAGEGSILSAGVIVGARTTLGRHVLVNRGALIGHHTEIGDYVSLQPGANIAGACRIGAQSYVGMGAVVIDHVTIGSSSVIGAGAVVTRDVPDNVQVVGVPARIGKSGIEGR